MKKKKISYVLIRDYPTLSKEVETLKNEKIIGVDLESDSLFHYKEKVCLLQISTNAKNLLIDPLSLKGLSPLSTIFADRGITKIFHGSDYDIRSLYRDFKIEVNSLFDTQLAARILGSTETSLAYLLKEYFDATLEKKYQKRDWSRRPLPGAMLNYAVYDTCFLIPLSRILTKQLFEKKRYHWFEEECYLLSRVRPPLSNDNPLYLKFKGAGKLTPRNLALLENILNLREDMARKKDRPPFRILRNEQVMDIVRKKPATMRELYLLSESQKRIIGKAILRNIREVMNLPDSRLPKYPKKEARQLGSEVNGNIKVLKEWRQRRAEKLDIDISLVCTNTQIHSIATSCPRDISQLDDTGVLRNWQKKLFGDEICKVLNSPV